ncbi:MAG: nitrous oxide reductase family maturation protein NosD [Sulfuriferula sp.]
MLRNCALTTTWLIGLICVLFSQILQAAAPSLPLARAITEAVAGAVITVPPGIHRVNLLLTKAVTLVGAPGAVLDGGGKGDVIRITASGVTVRNLTIRHSGTDLTTMNAGIYIERKARHVTVASNRLEDVLFGVYLDGPADVQVLDNRITGIASLRLADRGDGIHLWNDTNTEIKGNDISGTRDGIYIYISPHNRIVGNRIHDLRYGIHYMYSNHDLIADNFTYHTQAGFALMSSDHLKVYGNRSESDISYGILLNYVTYSDFAGNIIHATTGERGMGAGIIPGAEGKGIFVYNSEFNSFHGNTIEDCPIGIHVTAGSDQNQIYRNVFANNRVQVKYVQNIAEEWSRDGAGNYWSDYLGWDLDGNGIGDVPYRPNDGVDVLLWKYPGARLLLNSPAILALRYVQRAFPVFMPPSIQDTHPLMRPPLAKRNKNHAERD